MSQDTGVGSGRYRWALEPGDRYPHGMLAFVTSMPHPANCASYERRSQLLAATLRSILGQTSADFTVVVVVNDDPACDLPNDDRIQMERVTYAPPNRPKGRPIITVSMYADKGAKLSIGTAAAVRARADYVMFVDSDDYVSRRLAAFVSEGQGGPGWYSDAGYFHVRNARTVTSVDHGFHQRNGSTHILRTDLVGVPGEIGPDMARDDVIDRVGRSRVQSLMGTHKGIVSFFEGQGESLAPLPFPAAIWEIGTGENFSQVLAAAGRKVPVAGRISDEFRLPVPSTLHALTGAVAGFRARATTRLSRRFESVDEARDRLETPDDYDEAPSR